MMPFERVYDAIGKFKAIIKNESVDTRRRYTASKISKRNPTIATEKMASG